jgi:hypothetical protein
MPSPSPSVISALRLLGIGKRRIRELIEWAALNPEAASLGAQVLAGVCRHRVVVLEYKLKHRRWKGRLPIRIARMRSASEEFSALSEDLKRRSFDGD